MYSDGHGDVYDFSNNKHPYVSFGGIPMKLATTYLGFKLRTPLVPSASPLSEKLDNIKRMEDAGASAVVFHSLFEEHRRPTNHPWRRCSGNGGEFSSDALNDYAD